MINVFKNWMKKIEKTNDAFTKANKARKRVMIAKDVILALDEKLFRASGYSGYLSIQGFEKGYTDNDKYYNSTPNKDFRDLLIETNPTCDVCAKGAIFACTVMRRDKLTYGEQPQRWRNTNDLSIALNGIFEQDQLDLIEANYEYERNGTELSSNKDFAFKDYPNGRLRLVAIMKNIIKYGGTFKPELE